MRNIIKFKRTMTFAKIPTKATEGAACFDAYLPITYPSILPGERKMIPLGFQVEVPEGYELQVRPRSGLASRGLMIANSPGCIDSDYRGDVGVILVNMSDNTFPLVEGDRICQLKLAVAPEAVFVEVEELSDTERGTGGFGHTGGHSSLKEVA